MGAECSAVENPGKEETTNAITTPFFDESFKLEELPNLKKMKSSNKELLYEIALATKPQGTVQVARLRPIPFTSVFPKASIRPIMVYRQDVYDYELDEEKKEGKLEESTVFSAKDSIEWHVNFADKHLFVAYASPLFAQDEIQAAEMPSLAQIRELLLSKATDPKFAPETRHKSSATPILIKGAKRTVKVELNPDMTKERPHGLYGNNFDKVSPNAIKLAAKTLDPPQTVNIIAMAALNGGVGTYSFGEIHDLYSTAYTSFVGAKNLSDNKKVIIHTGNWGTGAYGGNKTLMACIQLAAAWDAGVDKLVYHTFNAEGTKGFQDGLKLFDKFASKAEGKNHKYGAEFLTKENFQWGRSDGN